MAYSQEIADTICARLAEGEPLRQICRDADMPAWRTVYDWMEEREDFAARIAHARAIGYDAIASECLEIADDMSSDYIETEQGSTLDREHVQRSKLRIETRLKLLAKWDPKRYGDKVQTEHSGRVAVETITRRIVDPKQ